MKSLYITSWHLNVILAQILHYLDQPISEKQHHFNVCPLTDNVANYPGSEAWV